MGRHFLGPECVQPVGKHPELQALKIPPGTWRVRAEAITAPGGSNDIYQHVDYIDPTDYENGKGTWDTLPFQLHLWFWPEPQLCEAKHIHQHNKNLLMSMLLLNGNSLWSGQTRAAGISPKPYPQPVELCWWGV